MWRPESVYDETGHLDEGVVHAWLDGALAPESAGEVEAHAAGCATCTARVAEARGLIAGAGRVLGALDGDASPVVRRPPAGAGRVAQRRWSTRRIGLAAAAAFVFVAGSVVLREGFDGGSVVREAAAPGPAPEIAPDSAVASSAASTSAPPPPSPAPSPAPRPTAGGASAPAEGAAAGSATGAAGSAFAARAVPEAPPAAAPAAPMPMTYERAETRGAAPELDVARGRAAQRQTGDPVRLRAGAAPFASGLVAMAGCWLVDGTNMSVLVGQPTALDAAAGTVARPAVVRLSDGTHEVLPWSMEGGDSTGPVRVRGWAPDRDLLLWPSADSVVAARVIGSEDAGGATPPPAAADVAPEAGGDPRRVTLRRRPPEACRLRE